MLIAALILACNDGTTTTTSDSGDDEDPAEHACEQVALAGAEVAATAAADGAPVLDPSEEPFDVTLVDEGGGVYSGFVTLEADEELDALLFAAPADVVATLWQDGVEVGLPTPGPNEFCPDDIPEHWPLELEPGTYDLALGPSAEPSLWLMFLSAEGHVTH